MDGWFQGRVPWGMRSVGVLVLCIACGDGGGSQRLPDATLDTPSMPQTCDVPSPLCGTSEACGNGQIDDCWVFANQSPHDCSFQPSREVCDSTLDVPSCTSLGFYGGTTTCPTCKSVDTSDCEACPPGSTTCITEPPISVEGGAVSGTQVALVSDSGVWGSLTIYEGLTFEHTTTLWPVKDITAVPGGWQAIVNNDLYLVDGNGSASPLGGPFIPGYKLVYGAGNRVLRMWREPVPTPTGTFWQVRYSIAETSGVIVHSGIDLPEISDSQDSLASSSTSFFLGADGELARITPDGTHTVEAGFPSGSQVSVLWSGTTGWYVTFTLSGTSAQRFDGNGIKVGTPIALTDARRVTADGDDLLVLRQLSGRFVIDRVGSNGTVVATSAELGGGEDTGIYFTRIGTQSFVAWSRQGHLQLSLIDF
jgi:hypothetical protein